jgi:hypothetical protein
MRKEKLLVKKLAGLNKKSLLGEIENFDRYIFGQTKIILSGKDTPVKDIMSYDKWLCCFKKYPVIKVEGLENIIDLGDTVHLFYSTKSGASFKWHFDFENVYLYVLTGKKMVQIKNKTIILTEKSGVHIPKRTMHKVFSKNNTIAISVGFNK